MTNPWRGAIFRDRSTSGPSFSASAHSNPTTWKAIPRTNTPTHTHGHRRQQRGHRKPKIEKRRKNLQLTRKSDCSTQKNNNNIEKSWKTPGSKNRVQKRKQQKKKNERKSLSLLFHIFPGRYTIFPLTDGNGRKSTEFNVCVCVHDGDGDDENDGRSIVVIVGAKSVC